MRAITVAKRLIKQISADKRSLGLMFVAPVFIMFLFFIIMNGSSDKPSIALINPPEVYSNIIKEHANIEIFPKEEEAIEGLKNRTLDGYIKFEDKVTVVLEGTDPTSNMMVLGAFQKSLQELMTKGNPMLANTFKGEPEIQYFYGSEDFTTFDSLAPLLMGFFIFFFVFIISGISFLRERISGTLDRVLATPLKRWEIVIGYFLGFGIFVAIQTLIIQSFIVYGLKVPMLGEFWLLLLLNLILATVALSLGTFLSAFARNEFQLFQFIPIVIMPQILFSGIFDLAEAPLWVAFLAKVFPLTYAAEPLRDIMIRGLGMGDIQKELLVLLAYAIFFLALNTVALKKYRKA